jgi:hypothetical protein
MRNMRDDDDVIIEEVLHFEHGTRRIRRPPPKLCLYLAHERREAVQVGYVDGDAHAILQRRD